MKVVMLGNYPTKIVNGGVAVHTKNLVKSLGKINRRDNQLYFVSFGREQTTFNEGGVKIIIIKTLQIYYIFPFLAIFRLFSEILKIKPDIIHVQGTNISPYLLCALLPSSFQKIITIHGLMDMEAKYKIGLKNYLLRYISRFAEKYALKKSQNLIICSDWMRQMVTPMTKSNLHLIPNGIDFKFIQTAHTQIQIKHPSLFFIGTLRKVKGIDVILKAVPMILDAVPDIHLYIAGMGEQEIELKQLSEDLQISANVTFVGFISETDKFSYFKSADICIFPSIYEPFGIVLLEAMACGGAIIASNVGGIPQIVENMGTGILVKPGDSKELAIQILTLLGDIKFQEKIRQAGREKSKQFSWDKIAHQTNELYYDIYLNEQSVS